jgi:excisionase family DNA binding protein
MSFVDNFFKRGRINIITGNPGVGKSHATVYLTHRSIDYGKRVLSNICMFKKENIPEAKRRGWLNPKIDYLEIPDDFKYIPTASELIIESSKGDNNIVVIDEAGITASSSKALGNTAVQMKFLGMSIRKIGACLILIAQDEDTVVPLLRSKIVTYKVDILWDETTNRRDLQFHKAHKFFNESKGKMDVKMLPHGNPIRNVPPVHLPYDTQHPGGFIFDINLENLYQIIAKSGYDSVEINKHIEDIVRDMVAEYKIDNYLKKQQFIGTGKVAGLLGKHRSTIQNWAKDGKLNAIKDHGGSYLFSRAEIMEIMTGKKVID